MLADHFFEPLAVTADTARVRLPLKKLLLVLGAVGTAYAAALLIWSGSPGALSASLSVLWSWTGLQAALLCFLNYVLRGARWRLWMAHYGRRFSWFDGLRLYLAGYAFTPTPGNVGEAVRGLMLARQPLNTRQSLAIFGAERLADLLCLLLLCLPAVWWGLMHGALALTGTLVLGLAGGGAIAVGLLLGAAFGYRARLLRRFAWLQEAWTCLSVRPLIWFVLTFVAWAAQGTAVWLLCRALEVHLQLLTAIGFYAVAMVAGALSALPAGLGGTEAVLAGLLVAQSATPGEALVITVLSRLLTLWLAVAIGLAALLYSAAIAKDITLS
jgi:uncharacterized membrane protein YbhN (UPF0104 family)